MGAKGDIPIHFTSFIASLLQMHYNESMDIYLDTCCLQRPLDDRFQARINIEAEAVLTILGLAEVGSCHLVSSDILQNEISRIPDVNRRDSATEILNIARKHIELTNDIELQAIQYMKEYIKPMDALHLASAAIFNVDFFCTVDDKFFKKAKKSDTLKTKIISPMELIAEVEK
jgi:predicted nucleic acid-binding protein